MFKTILWLVIIFLLAYCGIHIFIYVFRRVSVILIAHRKYTKIIEEKKLYTVIIFQDEFNNIEFKDVLYLSDNQKFITLWLKDKTHCVFTWEKVLLYKKKEQTDFYPKTS